MSRYLGKGPDDTGSVSEEEGRIKDLKSKVMDIFANRPKPRQST